MITAGNDYYIFPRFSFFNLYQLGGRQVREIAVSYTHLDVYKRQAKDKVALDALRNVKKVFLEAKTAPGANDTLSDADALKIIQKLVKQGTDSAGMYIDQGRTDLADAAICLLYTSITDSRLHGYHVLNIDRVCQVFIRILIKQDMETINNKPRIIVSGGGTGGHIFPAVSIANAIKELCPDAEILFVGAEGRMEMQRVPDAGYKIIGLPVAGFDRKRLWKNFAVLIKLVRRCV